MRAQQLRGSVITPLSPRIKYKISSPENSRSRLMSSTSSSSIVSTGSNDTNKDRVTRTSKSLLRLAGLIKYACANCDNSDVVLSLCGNCRETAYCCKECQIIHWSKHRAHCQLKNPTYFQKNIRSRIEWFTKHVQTALQRDSNYLKYLVDAFRVRCLEEESLTETFPKADQVQLKFTRFLHAAKGAGLTPKPLSKVDFMYILNEALFRLRLLDFMYSKNNSNALKKTEKSLNAAYSQDELKQFQLLNDVIYGPIMTQGSDDLNII